MEENKTENLQNNTLQESVLGNYVADAELLTNAYSSTLGMQLEIGNCMTVLEYPNPTFPGESLSGEECADAGISKPSYSDALSGVFSSAQNIASEMSATIDDLATTIDNQIQTFKAEEEEAKTLLEDFLSNAKLEVINDYLKAHENDAIVNTANLLTAENIKGLIGQMNEEEYNEFISGIEKYYDAQISGVKHMQQVNADVLKIINSFLYDTEMDDNYINYQLTLDSIRRDGWGELSYWTSYEDAVEAGYSNIMTEEEFNKQNPNGDYQVYLQEQQNKPYLQQYKDIIDQKIKENEDLKKLGITTYEELLREKSIEEQKQVALREGLMNLTLIRDNAKYDYLPFSKEYAEFENPYKEWNKDFYFALSEYLADKSGEQIRLNDESSSSFANIDQLKESLFSSEEISELFGQYGIHNYDELMQAYNSRDLFEASEYDFELAKTYAYYYNQDLELAKNYKETVQYKVNNIKGQIEASEALTSLFYTSSDKEFAINENFFESFFNTMFINFEGLEGGIKSFTEALEYAAEALYTGLSRQENRIHSVEEYKQMYFLQAISSMGEKEKYGLTINGQNNYEINPYGIIDYSKNYAGKWLDEKYQLSHGVGNILPSILISTTLAPLAGSLLLGLSSGGSAYHNKMVEGYSYERSLFYGILTGSTEAITERYLGGLPGLSETEVVDFKSWLVAAIKEGNEEVYQDLMDVVFKSLATGEAIELPENAEEFAGFTGGLVKTWAYGAITAGILNAGHQFNTSIMDAINESIESYSSVERITKSQIEEYRKNHQELSDRNDSIIKMLIWKENVRNNYYQIKIDGITFASATEVGLNSLVDYYNQLKENNPKTIPYLSKLSKKDLYITDTTYEKSVSFQSGSIIFLAPHTINNLEFSTFYHETRHFLDYDKAYNSVSSEASKIANNYRISGNFKSKVETILGLNELGKMIKSYRSIRGQLSPTVRESIDDIYDGLSAGLTRELYGWSGHGSKYYKSDSDNLIIEAVADVSEIINDFKSGKIYDALPKDLAQSLILNYYENAFVAVNPLFDKSILLHKIGIDPYTKYTNTQLINAFETKIKEIQNNPSDLNDEVALLMVGPTGFKSYLDAKIEENPKLINEIIDYQKGVFNAISDPQLKNYLDSIYYDDIIDLYLEGAIETPTI